MWKKNINNLLAPISLLLISFLAQAMDVSRPWHRLNEQTQSFELPFRTYRNANTGKSVVLLSMCHIAKAGFYQRVNELISDKTVIYEFNGGDWQEHCRLKKEIELLDSQYARRFSLVMLNSHAQLAKHHKISYQGDCLNYDLARELIHADLKRESKISLWGPQGAQASIDGFIIQQYDNFASHFELPTDESDVDKMAEAIFAESSKRYPDLKSFVAIMIEESNNQAVQKQFIHNRNPILKQSILESLNNRDELLVTYGAAHIPDIETFLLELGFALQDETWMIVFDI